MPLLGNPHPQRPAVRSQPCVCCSEVLQPLQSVRELSSSSSQQLSLHHELGDGLTQAGLMRPEAPMRDRIHRLVSFPGYAKSRVASFVSRKRGKDASASQQYGSGLGATSAQAESSIVR